MDDDPIQRTATVDGRIVVAVIVIGGFLLAFIGLRYRVQDPSKLPGVTQPSLMENQSAGGTRAP